MKPVYFSFLALVAILLALIPELYSKLTAINIHPGSFAGKTLFYSDSSEIVGREGNSSIQQIPTVGSEVTFTYTLNDSFPYYYSGIFLQINKEKPLDVSKFSDISLDLDAGTAKGMMLFILTDEFPQGEVQELNDSRHIQHQIVNKKRSRDLYRMHLDQFYTPQWWYQLSGRNPETVEKFPLKRVIGFKLESGEGEMIRNPNTVTLYEIKFFHGIPLQVRILQGVLLIAAGVLLLLRFGFVRRGELGQYTPVVMGTLFDEELNRITNYIGSAYPDENLSLAMVAEQCAMHQDKVTTLLRRGYGQTYKQYLNRLRLTEAQRLLRTTDRPIQEIASAVGYKSLSHFNRVFKEFFSSTPREFRS